MSFYFHPEAERELHEAIDYYEAIEPGLGYDFSLEVYAAIQLAMTYPEAWPPMEMDIRRVLTRRFPYGVLYSSEHDALLIIAIMNLHREPDYWKHKR